MKFSKQIVQLSSNNCMTLQNKFRPALVAAALCILPGIANAENHDKCSIDSRIFELKGDSDTAIATLRFEKIAEPTAYSDLGMVIHVEDTGNDYSFSMTQAQGYGNVFMLSDNKDLFDSDLKLFFFGNDTEGKLMPYLNIIPTTETPAPDAVFMPDLGSALWYATNGKNKPDLIPSAIWYVIPCKG